MRSSDMEFDDSAYDYGGIDTDGGLGDDEPPEGCEHGTDAVIVDGDAMTYRSYERASEPE